MSEIAFFTAFWDPKKVPQPKMVYVGAAPGNHINILAEMYPEFEFHLYDPAPIGWEIKESPKVRIYKQLFTDDDTNTWKDRNDVFFVSDIRSDIKIDEDDYKPSLENEKIIIGDMRRQENWHKTIKPVATLLKMRIPYAIPGIPDKFTYLSGYIFKQVYPGQSSTETRLVPDGIKEATYDVKKYEDQMFYHNSIVREEFKYTNPFTRDNKPIDAPNFLNDYDSLAATQILIDYFTSRGASGFPLSDNNDLAEKQVVGLLKLITQSFKDHGNLATINEIRLKNQTYVSKGPGRYAK
jgi:hypothetical protein